MNLEALLKQAMELEKTHPREISQFWSGMAEDEKRHYESIVKLNQDPCAACRSPKGKT